MQNNACPHQGESSQTKTRTYGKKSSRRSLDKIAINLQHKYIFFNHRL